MYIFIVRLLELDSDFYSDIYFFICTKTCILNIIVNMKSILTNVMYLINAVPGSRWAWTLRTTRASSL